MAKLQQEVFVTIRLRPGRDDEILTCLRRVPKGQRSAYIRQLLKAAGTREMDREQATEVAASGDEE